MIMEFTELELNVELYILGEFDMILLFKDKCILNKTHKTKNHCKDFRPEIEKYNESCSICGFKHLIYCPTRTTCNSSTLIDQILTCAQDNMSQSSVINTVI